jgi:hypothetical protein
VSDQSQRINRKLTLAVTGAVSNGGLIRLTTTAQSRQLRSGDRVIVANVGGVPNATGTWSITAISATVNDLVRLDVRRCLHEWRHGEAHGGGVSPASKLRAGSRVSRSGTAPDRWPAHGSQKGPARETHPSPRRPLGPAESPQRRLSLTLRVGEERSARARR